MENEEAKTVETIETIETKKEIDLSPVVVGDITGGFDLFRLGDPNTGWIPEYSQLKEFAESLKDIKYPRPFMVYNYGIEVLNWHGNFVFLLGDRNLGWIPSKENQEEFIDVLKGHLTGDILVYHYGVSRECIGL